MFELGHVNRLARDGAHFSYGRAVLLEIVFAVEREDVHFQNVFEKCLHDISSVRHIIFVLFVRRFSARLYTISLGNRGVESGDFYRYQ